MCTILISELLYKFTYIIIALPENVDTMYLHKSCATMTKHTLSGNIYKTNDSVNDSVRTQRVISPPLSLQPQGPFSFSKLRDSAVRIAPSTPFYRLFYFAYF